MFFFSSAATNAADSNQGQWTDCCICGNQTPCGICERSKGMYNLLKNYFWISGLPEGVLSNRPCPCVSPSMCVSVCLSLNISETVHWFLLIFCMKLGHHKGTKKSWGVTNGGKPPFLGHFLGFLSISLHPVIKSFWNFTYIASLTLSNS